MIEVGEVKKDYEVEYRKLILGGCKQSNNVGTCKINLKINN